MISRETSIRHDMTVCHRAIGELLVQSALFGLEHIFFNSTERNECTEPVPACNRTISMCEDTVGSYRCHCNIGVLQYNDVTCYGNIHIYVYKSKPLLPLNDYYNSLMKMAGRSNNCCLKYE